MPARTPAFIQHHTVDNAVERQQIIAGLLASPPTASPKFFYDRLGSLLFDAITELPEYYPTRTEAAIFAAHGAQMAQAIGPGCTLIDLGAGDGAKAARLFPLLEPRRYIAVDISTDYLRDALRQRQREQPSLEMIGVGMDFTQSPRLPAGLMRDNDKPVFFYPGSSIGNFTCEEAEVFLRAIGEQSCGGGLVIGVDLVKDRATTEAAYDDALGVTAAFNLNLLRRLNALIGANFDPHGWRHVAFFNAAKSRIEMHLEALTEQVVHWTGGGCQYKAGVRIHTESSYKYTIDSFSELLHRAGFKTFQTWTTANRAFAVFWART